MGLAHHRLILGPLLFCWLQELDLRYSQAQVLLSAVKEKGTSDTNEDRYLPSHRSKKVSKEACYSRGARGAFKFYCSSHEELYFSLTTRFR